MAIAVITVLAFGLADLSVTHLRLTARSNSSLKASTLARSAVSAGIAEILADPEFGRDGDDEATVLIETKAGTGHLTFSADRADDLDTESCTNNLQGTEPTEDSLGNSVPPATVHLIGVGRSGGVERRIEATLRLPPFPWAIAAGGKIETRNGVLVGSLPKGVWPPPPEDELLPADLVANSRATGAVTLGQDSTILGNVETPGTVDLSAKDVKVSGEILSGVRPVEIPKLKSSDYDPANLRLDFDNLNRAKPAGQRLELTGTARHVGNLLLEDGLNMKGCHLFVDGDLEVRKGLSGQGLIVSTGNVSVESGLTLDAATELALLADGEVSLSGSGRASSTVRGLFYAGEGLKAEEMTLAGTLLAGNAQSGIGLNNVRVLAEKSSPTQVSGAPSSHYFVGKAIKAKPGEGVDSVIFAFTDEFPNYQAAFSLRITPSAGGKFPIKVHLQPGYFQQLNQEWIVNSRADIANLEMRLNALMGNLAAPNEAGFDWMNQFFLNHPLEDLVLGQGNTTPGQAGGSIDLYGDISRFLPLEDRIRVVSWFEK